MKKLLLSRKGFSLVQVIVAMGLLSGIMVSAFKILQQQVKVGQNSFEDFEAIYIVDEMNTILSNPRNCGLNLKDKFSLEDSLDEFKEYQGDSKATLYAVGSGQSLEKAGLVLEEILIDGNGEEFIPQLGQTLLKLKFRKKDSVKEKFEKAIPIHIVENNSGKIESCFSLGGISEMSIGSYKSPWEPGENRTIFATGKKMKFNRERAEYPEDIIVDKGIIVRMSGILSCQASKEGTFYYDEDNNLFKVCSNGAWKNFNPQEIGKMQKKDFSFTSNSQGIRLFKIPEAWKQCSLKEYKGTGGECSVSTSDQISDMRAWEATLLKSRGRSISCSFTCIK
ncbi:MAG: hypothetical protein GY909_02345 [Oligoflexia bacterium]|nr:hypothetical protein [Oligoflexia bacterium]